MTVEAGAPAIGIAGVQRRPALGVAVTHPQRQLADFLRLARQQVGL